MDHSPFISILIAEDNDISREMLSGILRTQGFLVYGAIDGESAITVVEKRPIDLALVDINMVPKGGFPFVRYLLAKGNKLPVILITGDKSSDILLEANSLGIRHVLQKPVDPEILLKNIRRLLRQQGLNIAPLAVEPHDTVHTPEQLMEKVWALAMDNVKSGKGGPYAALVTNEKGHILATGTSSHLSRIDPVGHAEVMALRSTAEKLKRMDLGDCLLYCSSYPTRVGQAVITSVGIRTVYYDLSPEDMGMIRKEKVTQAPRYQKIATREGLAIFQNLQNADKKR